MPQYLVSVINQDVSEGEDDLITFFANANQVIIKPKVPVWISSTALENLLRTVQRRPRPTKDGEIEYYEHTRFPTTVLDVKYSKKEIKDGLHLENKKKDEELLHRELNYEPAAVT